MNLKKLRLSAGLSQSEIAKQLDMKLTTYWGYESNTREMDYSTLIKVADYFNCSVDYLIGHQSSDIVYFDSLTSVQKKLVELIQKLNDEQGLIVIGYLSDMLKIPYEQVKPVRPW